MSIANTCRNNGVPVGSTHSCGPRVPWCVTNLCHGLCYVSIALLRVFNQARGPFIVSDPLCARKSILPAEWITAKPPDAPESVSNGQKLADYQPKFRQRRFADHNVDEIADCN